MRRVVFGLIVVVLGVASSAPGQVLYDGPLGTAPQDQPWLAHYTLPGTGTSITAGGKTTYSSVALFAEQGGYSNHTLLATLKNGAFPTLNRAAGYTLSFDLKLLSESHSSSDRAGLSVILLSSDLLGIELGFWPDKIWAQSGSDFLHAEEVLFDTTAATTTYDLTISGSNYELKANGSPILSNVLRNYSAAGLVYGIPNFFFLGDDTSSAQGSFEFSRIVLVPEPMMGAIVAMVMTMAPLLRSTRRNPSRQLSPCLIRSRH